MDDQGLARGKGAHVLKVIVVHPSLNRLGGAEKACVRMIEALIDAGHEVTLYTVDKTRWAPIEDNWGPTRRPAELWHIKRLPILNMGLVKWPIFLISYISLLAKAARKRGAISINNYGEIFPLFATVAYVHASPLFSASNRENPYAIPLWAVGRPLYLLLLRALSNRVSSLILTNSRYNAGRISQRIASHIVVVYPPIDHQEAPHQPKRAAILTASRLSKTKNLGIIPRIASMTEANCIFYLALTTGTGGIKQAAPPRELIAPKTRLLINPTRGELRGLRLSSAIYLSTQPTEALGLSILEAMDAGCIPIVPKDGGPWHDILEEKQGIVGYAFETCAEAAAQIDLVLSDPGLRNELSGAARRRASSFRRETFSEPLLKILERVDARRGIQQV